MFRWPRCIKALVLVILYALITISPLAPLALHSPVIAHAVTGECANDCSICGCSVERSADHTCCCWQKRLQQLHEDDLDEPECCKKQRAAHHKTAAISSRPCNSSKTMALWGAGSSEVLPYRFIQGKLSGLNAAPIIHHPDCLAEWAGEPPDPPPELSFLS